MPLHCCILTSNLNPSLTYLQFSRDKCWKLADFGSASIATSNRPVTNLRKPHPSDTHKRRGALAHRDAWREIKLTSWDVRQPPCFVSLRALPLQKTNPRPQQAFRANKRRSSRACDPIISADNGELFGTHTGRTTVEQAGEEGCGAGFGGVRSEWPGWK